MSISFAPSHARDNQSDNLCALRISVVEAGGGGKRWRNRCVGFDFRVHPEVGAAWGLAHGDHVVGHYDEDGSWSFRRVEQGESGYQVRTGGEMTARGNRIHGRIGYLYFRFSCTRAQARAIFGDRKNCECDFIGVEGRKAMFIPKVTVRHLDFQPAS